MVTAEMLAAIAMEMRGRLMMIGELTTVAFLLAAAAMSVTAMAVVTVAAEAATVAVAMTTTATAAAAVAAAMTKASQ